MWWLFRKGAPLVRLPGVATLSWRKLAELSTVACRACHGMRFAITKNKTICRGGQIPLDADEDASNSNQSYAVLVTAYVLI